MYLKSLEIVGFKSFADKTKLEFEPGMTAIVGPNGCGKSNVSDAVRWVLGEQSAKAMRGSKMEDVIFNGTDTHKPLGMAEVSLMLADCEKVLGLGYNEVTITRRVFRSGEGQYFINKAPCRLKDIQRLFMDTGIGANAYSILEQGRIDKILSSHPEDRRAVFEEASGITKFKADKKEAMRKLDQTEANLLRLADIVREVRRQIISLQRQAGKARRYQSLQEQLRSIDLYVAREKLQELDQEIITLETRITSINEQHDALHQDVAQTEQSVTQLRADSSEAEKAISAAMEASLMARTQLDRLHELIRHNEDRTRELQGLAERDTKDAQEAKTRLAQHETTHAEQLQLLEKAGEQRDAAEQELSDCAAKLNACEQAFAEAGKLIHKLRTEEIDNDVRSAQLQNELSTLDAEERTNIIRRERLAAELAELQRTQEVFQAKQNDMIHRVEHLKGEAARCENQLKAYQVEHQDKNQAGVTIHQTLMDLQVQIAGKQAQLDLLQQSEQQKEGFSDGARLLLESNDKFTIDRANVLGPLADFIHADADYQIALETSLRPWLDAIVVKDQTTTTAILNQLETLALGSARLVTVDGAVTTASYQNLGDRLVDHVQCAEQVRPLLEKLLGNVIVVHSLNEITLPLPQSCVVVTRKGSLIQANGIAEFWQREKEHANPLARQQLIKQWSDEILALQDQIRISENTLTALRSEESVLQANMNSARTALEESRRNLALAEGENQVITQEARQSGERVETVAWELKALNEQYHSGDDRRASILSNIDQLRNREEEIRATISQKNEELRDLELARTEAMREVTDKRVEFSEHRQRAEHISTQAEQLASRIEELKSLIEERSQGIDNYHIRIQELEKSTAESRERLQPVELEVQEHHQHCETIKTQREQILAKLNALEAELRQKRDALDAIRNQKSQNDIEIAEQRIRRQNLLDRVTGDYRITFDQIFSEAEPTWENGQKPDRETMETMVAELKTKLEAMGPVNLVAIEEHRELEERLNFLTTQQTDLVNSKQQLMDLIREINKKTTDMFSQTFELVNKNFQDMFVKLFGGGTAKLVLVDEADVLESGIEIIARPPGKKLQTVSLLSGGERTMTAVALLFSLYMVKPSPFCVLDELDAALDESNIGRFVKTVQGFLDSSQFVVITHNRQTISAAKMLYGVTMEEHGISKIVSVRFNDETKVTGPQTLPSAANTQLENSSI